MKITPVTDTVMINTIKFLTTEDSSGYDGISMKTLKCFANVISKPFTFVCKSWSESGIYPEMLKFAIIWPIHMKGDKTEMTNYRPISFLISFSKILET